MQKKLQRSLLFLILLPGLLFLEGQVFAQNNQDNQESTDGPNSPSEVIIQDENHALQEDHETRELEKLLKSYNKNQEKVLNDASKIHTIDQEGSSEEITENELEEMETPAAVVEKKRVLKKKEVIDLKNTKLSDSVRITLAPLQKLEEKELVKLLDENTKSSSMRPYLDEFPNIMLLAVRLIKDKESIPSLVKILEDKDRLIHFGGWMIGTIIFGMLLKRFFHREDRSFLGAVGLFFLRFYIMLFLRLALIYFYFGQELRPSLQIIKKTFF